MRDHADLADPRVIWELYGQRRRCAVLLPAALKDLPNGSDVQGVRSDGLYDGALDFCSGARAPPLLSHYGARKLRPEFARCSANSVILR